MTDHAKIDIQSVSTLALAFIGDSVMDLYVRRRIIESGIVRPRRFHVIAVDYVSAKAQAIFLEKLINDQILTEEEITMIKRGRNAKSNTIPKNTDVQTYRHSTALETLIGYLHLTDQSERVEDLLKKMFDYQPLEGRTLDE